MLLAGPRVWKGGVFCRPRFMCMARQGERHKFSVPRRQSTRLYPHGDTCPSCDARAGRTRGPITAVDHRFSAAEIAALLIRLGRGTSLREASQAARFDAQRHVIDQFGTRHASRQADLGAVYLNAFGAAIDEAVSPRAWPRILILDSKPLGVRTYQTDTSVEAQFRAGALLMAVGKSLPAERARSWRIGLAGDETAASWFDFLSELSDGEPGWVVCDGAAAIASAVRARWPRRPSHGSPVFFIHLAERPGSRSGSRSRRRNGVLQHGWRERPLKLRFERDGPAGEADAGHSADSHVASSRSGGPVQFHRAASQSAEWAINRFRLVNGRRTRIRSGHSTSRTSQVGGPSLKRGTPG